MDGARPTQQTARRRHNTPFAVHACTECTGTIYNELLGRMLAGLASGQFPARGKATWPLKKRSGRFPPPDGQEGSSLDPATTPFRNGIHPVSMPTCLPGSLATRLAREGILKGGARVRVRESRALVVFLIFFFFFPQSQQFLSRPLSLLRRSELFLSAGQPLAVRASCVGAEDCEQSLSCCWIYVPPDVLYTEDRQTIYTRWCVRDGGKLARS